MNIPLNIDWQQILLHLLNFVILAGGLYLLLYQPVKAFMENASPFIGNRMLRRRSCWQTQNRLRQRPSGR